MLIVIAADPPEIKAVEGKEWLLEHFLSLVVGFYCPLLVVVNIICWLIQSELPLLGG